MKREIPLLNFLHLCMSLRFNHVISQTCYFVEVSRITNITNSRKHFYWKPYRTWWRHQMETFSALLVFVRGFQRLPVDSAHKGQWRGALLFSLICTWTNGWANNRDAGDLRRHCVNYDINVMNLFTYYALVSPYGCADLGQHWFR